MTDTTDLPHSRACGITAHDHGRPCHSNCPTCAGHPDWTPDERPERASGRVRATIAVERLTRLLPDLGRTIRVEGTALTDAELADALERVHDMVAELTGRLSAAETEQDAYREAVEGGRAWLGLVVPELVYPQRVMLGADVDPAALEDWRATGGIYALPPDPLTALRQEVADLTAAVGRLADRGEPSTAQSMYPHGESCRAHHPGERCKPGENHPGAAG